MPKSVDFQDLVLSTNQLRSLEEADGYLTNALDKAEKEGDRRVSGEAAFKRSLVRRSLGREEEAADDERTFSSLYPNHFQTRLYNARRAYHSGKYEEAAISLRDLLKENDTPYLRFELIQVLMRKDDSESQQHAVGMAELLLGETHDDAFKLSILDLCIRYHLKHKTLQALRDIIDALPDEQSPFRNVALAQVLLLTPSNRDEALTVAKSALDLIDREPSKAIIQRLAETLLELQAFASALGLLETVYVPTVFDSNARHLITCALKLAHHDRVLKVCEELRTAGVQDEELLEQEISLLQQYDVEKAIRLLQEKIKDIPGDYQCHMLLTHIGIRLKRKDLLTLTPDIVPEAWTGDSRRGRNIIVALSASGFPTEALEFSYRLLRNNYSDELARDGYMGAVLIPETQKAAGHELKIPDCSVVQKDCAVEYADPRLNDSTWFVIEDDNPRIELEEIASDHPLATAMMGKTVGETVRISLGSIEREVTISRITDKFTYRFQRLTDEYHNLPPQDSAVHIFRTKPKGSEEHDLSTIMTFMKQEHDRQKEIKEYYSSTFAPIRLLGRNTFHATMVAASDPEVRINTCDGTLSEQNGVEHALRSSDTLVLDLSAIATMWILDCVDILVHIENPIVIPREVDLILKDELERTTASEQALIATESGFALASATGGELEALAERNDRFLKSLQDSARVVDCRELASCDPEWRGQMSTVLGVEGTQALVLSSRTQHVLWSDDSFVAAIGRKQNGNGSRIWTHGVIAALGRRQALDLATCQEYSSKLIIGGYRHIGISGMVLLKVMALLEWKLGSKPVSFALEQFSQKNIDGRSLVPIAVEFIRLLFLEPIMQMTRCLVIDLVLTSLAKRIDGVALIRSLREGVRVRLRLHPIGQLEALQIIDVWL